MKTVNKRIHYSYLHYENGLVESYVDVDCKIDADTGEVVFPTRKELIAIIARKWRSSKHDGGDINSVEQIYTY